MRPYQSVIEPLSAFSLAGLGSILPVLRSIRFFGFRLGFYAFPENDYLGSKSKMRLSFRAQVSYAWAASSPSSKKPRFSCVPAILINASKNKRGWVLATGARKPALRATCAAGKAPRLQLAACRASDGSVILVMCSTCGSWTRPRARKGATATLSARRSRHLESRVNVCVQVWAPPVSA